MGTHLYAPLFREIKDSDKGYGRTGNPKTRVVVCFIWIVPVAVGGTDVLWFVVPPAAANNTTDRTLKEFPW